MHGSASESTNRDTGGLFARLTAFSINGRRTASLMSLDITSDASRLFDSLPRSCLSAARRISAFLVGRGCCQGGYQGQGPFQEREPEAEGWGVC